MKIRNWIAWLPIFDVFLSSDGDEKRIAYETATDAPGDYNEYEYGEDEYEEAMTGPGEDYGQAGSLTHFYSDSPLFGDLLPTRDSDTIFISWKNDYLSKDFVLT